MLFIDADGDGKISDKREYVFTEWSPGAADDMEAIRRAFDTNGDGKLTSADERFDEFKVMVTNADGSTTVKTLASDADDITITEINLSPDATKILLPDGSAITGQSTFVMNGVTRIAGNVTLVADAQGYRVVEAVSTSGGVRTVVQTGYAATGDKAFVITSATSTDGSQVTNSYDVNGDGVVDQLQTITTVTTSTGKTETVTNYRGATAATGVLLSKTVTERSSDGKLVTIQSDHTGGGWYDQLETLVTNADGTRTHVTKDLAQNGAVIQGVTETLSVSGLVRTKSVDADGDGDNDTIVSETISTSAGVRSEAIVTKNGNNTVRESETTTKSTDAATHVTTKIVGHNLDGSGGNDVIETETSILSTDGETEAWMTVTSQNGTVLSSTHSDVSANGLIKTTQLSVDADATYERTIVDTTVIDAEGSRTNTIKQTNADGSVFEMHKTILEADKVSSETWVDLNQNGAFSAIELVKSVVVDAETDVRTTTTWDRNGDGSIKAQVTDVTSANGLSTTRSVDWDGDGDTDQTITDATVVSGDQSTARTITEFAEDGTTIITKSVAVTSSDGLMTITSTDLGGSNSYESKVIDLWVAKDDGSTSHIVSQYSGSGLVLLGQSTVDTSENRLVQTVEIDANGDGRLDQSVVSTTAANGAKTILQQSYFADGQLSAAQLQTVSANGLVATTRQDVNGDGVDDTIVTDTTVLAATGTNTRTVVTTNADGSLRSKTISTVNDDGLIKTNKLDADGDGSFEISTTSTTVLLADAAREETILTSGSQGSAFSRTVVTTSADGQVVTVKSDADNDNDFDLTIKSVTTLADNGSTTTTVETRNLADELQNQSVTTTTDDGRSTTISEDLNGNGGTYDRITTRVVALNGTETITVTNYAASSVAAPIGAKQSQVQTITSGTGLSKTTKVDQNGDGIFELVKLDTITFDAAGTKTETIEQKSSNGAVFAKELVSTSADGWLVTSQSDVDGNGDFEQTATTTYELSIAGVATTVTTIQSENDGILSKTTHTVSADGRTVSDVVNLGGDADNDIVSVTQLGDDGTVTQTNSYFAEGGGLEARTVLKQSGDGLRVTASTDANGDGRYELVKVQQTALLGNGGTNTRIEYHNDRYVSLAASVVNVDASGLHKDVSLDLDGDGIFERRSTTDTSFGANGSTNVVQSSYDGASNQIAHITSTTSGNKLNSRVDTDFNGDGGIDRSFVHSGQADGAWTEETRTYASGSRLVRDEVTTSSANGRSVTTVSDLDGDGDTDRQVDVETNLSRDVTTTIEDFKDDGDLSEKITLTRSANGMVSTVAMDVDGDGQDDLIHSTTISFAANGDKITAYRETVMPAAGVIGTGQLVYAAVTTAAANGLSSTTTFDIDGNGTIDGTTTETTTLNVDGSKVETSSTTYADDSLRAGVTTSTSADGRHIKVSADYDGNGIADQTRELVIGAGGEQTGTVTSYYEGGVRGGVYVTATSGDGLVTTITHVLPVPASGNWSGGVKQSGVTPSDNILTNWGKPAQPAAAPIWHDGLNIVADANAKIGGAGAVQTIVASPINNGSYIWNNGGVLIHRPDTRDNSGGSAGTTWDGISQATSKHDVDGLGIETWTMTNTWIERVTTEHQQHNSDDTIIYWTSTDSVKTAALSVRLDAAAKARVMAEAEHLYDAILDRDMDQSERELLITRITDGQLNRDFLATALLGSDEFQVRYSGFTNAEFVHQIFLNTLGRAPTLEELNAHLHALGDGSETGVALVVALAESAEHLVVGNGHLSTNNFDVISNPAQFERSFDKAYVADLISDLIDVVYDRNATAHEIDYFSKLLLKGTSTQEDIVALMRQSAGDIQGVSSKALKDLSGAALVEQTFVNALGRQPSAVEQALWEDNLSSGRITADQFIASLAQSIEHSATGNSHIANAPPSVSVITGTTGNDASLTGGSGQDSITGLAGNDVIYGGDGSDVLVGGAGNDTIAGGLGSDLTIWSPGDGNDTLGVPGSGVYLIQTDTLQLNGVSLADIVVSMSGGSNPVAQFQITSQVIIGGVSQTRTETITSLEGLERIVLGGDNTEWTLEALYNATTLDRPGLVGNQTLTADGVITHLYGGAGNDVLNGAATNDVLVGGTGNDMLKGGDGDDVYSWLQSAGVSDGNDTITDAGQLTTEIDTLLLRGVLPGSVSLARAIGNDDLTLTIKDSAGAIIASIRIDDRFVDDITGKGIEVIKFDDGTIWTLEDILDRTKTIGNGAVAGTALRDGLFGGAGTDTLTGLGDDDSLTGGLGNDELRGGAGSDTYYWSKTATTNDGSDSIIDGSATIGETDTLVLVGVNSDDVILTRTNTSTLHHDLYIQIGTQQLYIMGQFYGDHSNRFINGNGVERIVFADGVVWDRHDIETHSGVSGTAANDSIVGVDVMDNLFGLAGADTLTGYGGDDLLVGGAGNDVLDGGVGNDRFEWSAGENNDLISDSGTDVTEVDTLALLDVAYTPSVSLTRNDTPTVRGTDLIITIGAAVLTLQDEFLASAPGKGVEVIEFANGVMIEVGHDADASMIETKGTSANDSLSGWAFRDLLTGAAGNDTIAGNAGDDTLQGDAGVDSLDGGLGGDQYLWATSNGADIISETGTSQFENDVLVLTDIDVADAGTLLRLTRLDGENHLRVSVGPTSNAEEILIVNRFASTTSGVGIEQIEFKNGEVWTLEEILAGTATYGGTGAMVLDGTDYRDNLYAGDGNDTVLGNGGDDWIYGGLGVDSLNGGAGSDTYVWTQTHGSDTINDTSTSQSETDTLQLTNVTDDQGIELVRQSGSNDLLVRVLGAAGPQIAVKDQFGTSLSGTGIERIAFSNQVVWDLQDILAATKVSDVAGANSSLVGLAERDNLYGLDGNDTLTGNGGADHLYGGAGNDSLVGGIGSDTYYWSKSGSSDDGRDLILDGTGTNGEVDTLVLAGVNLADIKLSRPNGPVALYDLHITIGTSLIIVQGQFEGKGIERIDFDDGSWTLADIFAQTAVNGLPGIANDSLTGLASIDNLFGGDGVDTLNGNGGDDVLYGGAGADSLNGGSGVDTASYRDATQGVVVDLGLATAQAGVAGAEQVGDVLVSIENLTGSGFADTLTGNADSNVISGLGGNDSINGGDGFDQISGGDGIDTLEGGLGSDSLEGGAGNDTLYGGSTGDDALFGGDGNDHLNAGSGDDLLYAGAGRDTLIAGDGNDALFGGDSDDTLYGGAGADSLSGGDGIDVVGYSSALAGVIVNMATPALNTGDAAGDTYDSIENIIGSNFNDTLTADSGANALWGQSGNDVIDGQAGNDTLVGDVGGDSIFGGIGDDVLYGEEGDDSITGGAGNDSLYGGTDTDSLYGGDGNDILRAGVGASTFNGGAGVDRVDYGTAAGSVVVHLAQPALYNAGEALGHTYVAIEQASGSNYNDTITGDAAGNALWGLAGYDSLDGAAGDDFLFGGDGLDRLIGNTGNDTLYGEAGRDTGYGGAGNDVLDGGLENDSLYGDADNDIIYGGAGADVIDGGLGSDSASYAQATTGVTADLQSSSANTNEAAGDTYTSVENLVGSDFADVLAGDSGVNALWGQDGDDDLQGRAGNDLLFGGVGADTLVGGDGNDILDGGAGADAFVGDAGVDRVSYDSASAGVLVDLTAIVQNTGDAAGDSYLDIEHVSGSDFADNLRGDADNNALWGMLGNDTLSGRAGDDSLFGGDGNDILFGGIGSDTLDGGLGQDRVTYFALTGVSADLSLILTATGEAVGDVFVSIENLGGSNAADTLGGDAVANTLWGYAGNDSLLGRAGNDVLYGGDGNDGLAGEAGNDVLFGEADNDVLDGGDGNDTLDGGAGSDAFVGGAGTDEVSYATAQDGILADLTTATLNTNDAAGDSYVSIENLTGSSFDDNLRGDAATNILLGLVGIDTLYGRDGSDLLNGGEDNDALYGGTGNDQLIGGGGDDILDGGAGADQLIGGEGVDTAYYTLATTGISASLANDIVSTNDAAGDTYDGVENLTGSNFNDTLRGDANNNIVLGQNGNDKLYGLDGNDTLYAGNGDDTIYGGTGNEIMRGDAGNDVLYGEDGNDILYGGTGADTIDGGTGTDRASYSYSTTAVTVDLANISLNTGEAAGDVFISIENLQGSNYNDILRGDGTSNYIWGGLAEDQIFGRAGNDTLIAEAGNDSLYGETGNDSLYGGLGDDVLSGGDGNDLLDGGSGSDTFVFAAGFKTDQIVDFLDGDIIDVSTVTQFGSFNDVLSHAVQTGVDVQISTGVGDMIILKNTLLTTLGAEDFMF